MGKQVKFLVFLFLFIFLISVVSAQTYAQDTSVDIKVSCLNIDCGTTTEISIEYPNTTLVVDNATMTQKDGFVNYTFSATSALGEYKYYLVSVGGTPEFYEDSFTITYSGESITTGQGVLYISLFTILFFFFIITLFGINQLPSSNTRDEEGKILSISYLKYLRPVGWMFEYFLVIAILYLGSNLAFVYLNEQLFAQILFVSFRMLFGFAPIVVIVWMAWIYRQMFHDKQMQNLLNRGFFPQGKL